MADPIPHSNPDDEEQESPNHSQPCSDSTAQDTPQDYGLVDDDDEHASPSESESTSRPATIAELDLLSAVNGLRRMVLNGGMGSSYNSGNATGDNSNDNSLGGFIPLRPFLDDCIESMFSTAAGSVI